MDHSSDVNNELKRVSDAYTQSNTLFEPQANNSSGSSNERRESCVTRSGFDGAPEKRLTLFALRLAVLEKTATGLGALGFIWATVVLLGGFAITLDTTDFWFITIILLVEGGRIFSRSHELEWQHQATWSFIDVGINSFRLLKSSSNSIWKGFKSMFRLNIQSDRHSKSSIARTARPGKWNNGRSKATRRWSSSDVPLLPYASLVFVSRNVSKILQWLQILAAITCMTLSMMKIIRRDFGEIEKGDTDKRNRKAALLIFYGLAFAEASLFLLEKIYWELKVVYCKILEQVNKECEFGASGIISINRFFYDAYSRCVEGSVFDGLKMDMVSFAMELLSSDTPEEQLMGARILRCFSTSQRFSEDTLQKIGTTSSVVERLVEMLNWKDPQEEEIRHASATILSKLAGKKQNSLRVTGIPGAMESISSLLYVIRISGPAIDGIGEKSIIVDQEHYGFWTFNHLGLLILKKLARDHDNCGKIGNTKGLLPKIIDFTCAGESLLKDENVTRSQILTVKRSLQVIKMLACTTGNTGKQLRKEISEIVFTVCNIRDILKYGEEHPDLQKLGIEILTSLGMEEDASESIGGTGGVLRELMTIFLKTGISGSHTHVRTAAGEALAMLALESKQNCQRILKLGALDKLVEALHITLLRVNAARVLRNLFTYGAEEYFLDFNGIMDVVPTVLKGIICEENELQEVMLGLAAGAFKLTNYEETDMFERSGVKENELAHVLVQILRKHEYPAARCPRIRRFSIELAIWMMKDKRSNISIFKNLGFEKEVVNVLETTSEVESFNIFSGTVGLRRCRTSMHSLVETALNLLAHL